MSKIRISNAVTGQSREITVPGKKRGSKKATRPAAKPSAAKPDKAGEASG